MHGAIAEDARAESNAEAVTEACANCRVDLFADNVRSYSCIDWGRSALQARLRTFQSLAVRTAIPGPIMTP